jgi:hypothetical protein
MKKFFPNINFLFLRFFVIIFSMVLIFFSSSTTLVHSTSPTSNRSSSFSPNEFNPTSSKTKTVASKGKNKICKDKLAVALFRAGFTGEAHRNAWAIAMRESRGHRGAISRTNDYGLFQFNKATWGNQSWWNEKRLLKRLYNAKIAYKISEGGRTWYPWGLSGKGKVRAQAYRNIGWSKAQVKSHIKRPYKQFYKKYLSLPRSCRGV